MVSSLTHYSISRVWVFNSENNQRAKEFVSFFTIHSLNLLLSLIILFMLVEFANLWYILAKILTLVITAFTNFFMQKRFTFATQDKIQ